MHPTLVSREEDGDTLDTLVWRFPEPRWVASTCVVGGGVGERRWILNAQVPRDYQRRDLGDHVTAMTSPLRLAGQGVAMLTAARVKMWRRSDEDGVEAYATVGLSRPTWAASNEPSGDDALKPGTINVVVFMPVRLRAGGLLNLLTTATEAKSQALWEAGVPATGTASDALCVVSPLEGSREEFGGPRSRWGAPLARAVYAAVLEGATSSEP